MNINPYLSTFLDFMRGLAAFFVLVGHITLFIFITMFIASSSFFDLKFIGFIYYFIMSLFLALTINSLEFIRLKQNNKIKKISSFFASFSYSLYVVHFSFLVILSVLVPIIMHNQKLILYEFLIFIIVLILSFYYYTERKTNIFKQKFMIE